MRVQTSVPVVLLLVAGLLMAAAGMALAQASEITVRGSVGGDLQRGGQARFEVTATHPDGWQALRTVAVVLDLHGAVLEEVVYDVDGTAIEVGDNRAVAGTGNIAEGQFLRVGAFGLEVSTGGNRLGLSFDARVLEEPPLGARFRFVAQDDEDEEVATSIPAAVEEDGGLSWSVVVLAVLAALLAGGLLGSRVATHRRAPTSVYGAVARRLEEERKSGVRR
jgi:hypothetical protein